MRNRKLLTTVVCVLTVVPRQADLLSYPVMSASTYRDRINKALDHVKRLSLPVF